MRHREFRYRRPRRSRGLLWLFLGLAGIGTAAVVLGERRRRSSAPDRPEETPDSSQGFYPPEPPESVSVWVPGPAGNLYVRDGGKSEHVPIVFVHSLAGNGGQWALQLDHLRRRRRAVAFDLRGHGESDPAEDGDYSIAGLAADVEAVADQLGMRRFILAGHSLGSVVAIEYASRHPDRVAGLLLVDPNGDLTGMPQDQKESFVGPLRRDPIGELTSYYRQLVVGGDADAARWVLEDLRLTHEDAVVAALESSMEYPVLEALGKYPGPKLAVVSDMNNLPYSLHRMLPELTARLMTGAGHWLMMDRPELFNRIVDEFLEEVAEA